MAHKLLNRDEILENDLRARVIQHLFEQPGSYLGKIGRELSVPTSTLKYHLNILRSFDLVTTVKKGRCRHYFPRRRRYTDLEKRMYAALEHAPTRRIVSILYRNPGISQGGLVRETGLSQSTVAWHMAKLEDMNLIRSHRNDVKEYYLRGDFQMVLAGIERERGGIASLEERIQAEIPEATPTEPPVEGEVEEHVPQDDAEAPFPGVAPSR